MVHKFICRKCGQCCSHIQGFISQKDNEFLEEYAFGKLPLISLTPVKKTSFPLWDFEAKRFLKKAKDKRIDSKIKPSKIIFDLNENKTIIVAYSIDSDSCTFLKEGRCMIYEDRAFICRKFPFQHTPFLDTGEEKRKEDMFGSCPSITELLKDLNVEDKNESSKYLSAAFGAGFEAAVEHDIITEWVNKKIIELMKGKILRPALNYPYSFLLRRIETSLKIDFTDLLVEKSIYTRSNMDEIIRGFESCEEAKTQIGNLK